MHRCCLPRNSLRRRNVVGSPSVGNDDPRCVISVHHRAWLAIRRTHMSALPSPERAETGVTGFLGKTHQLFIAGRWIPAQSGETFEVLNPATGKVLSRAASGGAAEIDAAVAAARKAFQ